VKGAGVTDAEASLSGTEREKLDELTDRFRPMAAAVLADAHAAGLEFFLGEAYRSSEKSDAMAQAYAAGLGPRAAPGGQSGHNFREALDVNLTRGGRVISSVLDPDYQRFGAIVKAHGAVWGGDFTGEKDDPHFEHPDWRSLRAVA
jgi:hypothetical protein